MTFCKLLPLHDLGIMSPCKSLEFTKGCRKRSGVWRDIEKMLPRQDLPCTDGTIFLTGVTIRSGFSTPEAEAHLRKTWRARGGVLRKVGTALLMHKEQILTLSRNLVTAHSKLMNASRRLLIEQHHVSGALEFLRREITNHVG